MDNMDSSHPTNKDENELEIVPRNEQGGRMIFGKRHRKRKGDTSKSSSLYTNSTSVNDDNSRHHHSKKQSLPWSEFDFHSQSSQPQTNQFESRDGCKNNPVESGVSKPFVDNISAIIPQREAPTTTTTIIHSSSNDVERTRIQMDCSSPHQRPLSDACTSDWIASPSNEKQADLGLNAIATDIESPINLHKPLHPTTVEHVEATNITSPSHDTERIRKWMDGGSPNDSPSASSGGNSTTEERFNPLATDIETAQVMNSHNFNTSQPIQPVDTPNNESPSHNAYSLPRDAHYFESSSSSSSSMESFSNKSLTRVNFISSPIHHPTTMVEDENPSVGIEQQQHIESSSGYANEEVPETYIHDIPPPLTVRNRESFPSYSLSATLDECSRIHHPTTMVEDENPSVGIEQQQHMESSIGYTKEDVPETYIHDIPPPLTVRNRESFPSYSSSKNSLESPTMRFNPLSVYPKGKSCTEGKPPFVTPGSALQKALWKPTVLPRIRVDLLDSKEMEALQVLANQNVCTSFYDSSERTSYILVTHAQNLELSKDGRITRVCLKTWEYDQAQKDGIEIVSGQWLIESVKCMQPLSTSSFGIDGAFSFDADSSCYTIQLLDTQEKSS
jgi:hypothetical protein